ncbi:efflux RND transporter periplasmic adaptor subunit [Candidatus Formimonas warabiya]|uniref:Efflux transporter periplasmic adaptor subunit n=1 Tax=Formimonas warabiya TaxID=1761012 RepID=A0A3G1KM05_FORW1|nr:efflux RND transporter periplasmic adaptor subunit [Candidatus Formimonas warabiya]ATW23448.1 efflux transporter periplasmic adaptor subunit [Candidatus Formimonas warabiya]
MDTENEKKITKLAKFRLGVKKWSRRGKWVIPILVVAAVAIYFISHRSESNGLPVTTTKVERQDMEQTVVANGRLDAVTKQEFFAPVDSILMDLSVKVGDAVKKGQNLGRLDTLGLQRDLEEANADLAAKKAALAKARAVNDQIDLKHKETQYSQAKKHYERVKSLYDQGAVTAEDLESAETEYVGAEKEYLEASALIGEKATESEVSSLQAQVDLAEQEVAQADERVKLASFIANGDGVVLFVGAEKGSQVQEGTRLIVVGNTDALEVTANVNEMDAGSLKKGQPVKIECAVLPEKEFTGEVSRVSNAAITSDNQGNEGVSLPVTVKLTGDTAGLKLGFTVDLLITTMKEENLLTIPVEAIVSQEETKMVYVVENGTARKRNIRTALGNELYDVVISGLKEGEEIILNPPPELQDGQKVLVSPEQKTSSR